MAKVDRHTANKAVQIKNLEAQLLSKSRIIRDLEAKLDECHKAMKKAGLQIPSEEGKEMKKVDKKEQKNPKESDDKSPKNEGDVTFTDE